MEIIPLEGQNKTACSMVGCFYFHEFLPSFHIHSTQMDDTGHLRLIGTMEEGGSVKPDHRVSVEDQTGKKRTGRIDLVEEHGENGQLSLRIDNAHTRYFEGVELEGKKGKVLIATTGADIMVAAGYGPPRWWVGFAMVGVIGLILWILWYFDLG